MAVMNHVVLHHQPLGYDFKHNAEFFCKQEGNWGKSKGFK